MTIASLEIADTDNNPISISVDWSGQYIETGQTNTGALTISSSSPGTTISMRPGNMITLKVPGETGWTFQATDTSLWSTTNKSTATESIYDLIYVGTDSFAVQALSLLFVTDDLLSDLGSATRESVALTIAPPTSARAPSIHIELLNRDRSPVSYPFALAVNYIEPGVPLVAFAKNPALVLLSDIAAADFPNSITCAVLNNTATKIDSATLELGLQALDANQNPVSITQNLGSVSVGGALSWNFDSSTSGWSATLSKNIAAHNTFVVTIDNLVLDEASIDTLKVVFTISEAAGHAPYQTSAGFQAYGPYMLTLALDRSKDNAKFYTFKDAGPGNYQVNPLNANLREPPLVPRLINKTGNVVYPPVPGWFSWSKKEPDFVSGYQLQQNANPLYFLIPSGNNTYNSLTTCTASLNFYPQTLMAADYQQAYGLDPKKTKFGSVMPSGAIIMWGSTTIPPGWALCDGTNSPDSNVSVPDLRDKFILGAGGSEVVGNHGMADTHTHAISPNTVVRTSNDGSHGHDLPETFQLSQRDFSKGGTFVLACGLVNCFSVDAGNHSHTVDISNSGTGEQVGGLRPSWFALCFIIKL